MKRVPLKNIKFLGEFENTAITMDNYGLLPSMARYLKRSEKEEIADKDSPSAGAFRYFYRFMVNNEVFLVAKDHPKFDFFCPSRELLEHIMHANLKKVLDFDFNED